MEYNSLPIEGTSSVVEFYNDDTIDRIRQLIGLQVGAHPNSLFIELKCTYPKTYYSSPKHWMNLFFRLSYDGKKIQSTSMDIYLKKTRMLAGMDPIEVTLEQWETKDERLKPLYAPTDSFTEYRIFGYREVDSICLDTPPVPPGFPIVNRKFLGQSLFETVYPDAEFQGFRIHENKPTEYDSKTQTIYFPFFTSETPEKVSESEAAALQKSRTQLQSILSLKEVPEHKNPVITRARWVVSLDATDFTAPRNRFEQMFYGLTVSKTIPYVGFFTSKNEQIRHKFYVTDPKTKKPHLQVDMWKGWLTSTQPQRRIPTLLLYRGTSRSSFDKITVTPRDISFSIYRDKKSEKTLDEIKTALYEWFQTLDAIVPFFEESDVQLSNWKLIDLSATAEYKDTIKEFNMNRFHCLQSIFLRSDNKFRLLRVDRDAGDINSQLLQAKEILSNKDFAPTVETLVTEMGITPDQAELLYKNVLEADELDVQDYPVIEFNEKQVSVQFASNLDRTLRYVDILRYVLTDQTENGEVETVCPSIKEVVQEVSAPAPAPAPAAAVSNAAPSQDEFEDLGYGGGARKVAIKQGPQTTHGYFIQRLQEFDSDMFDANYSTSCEKKKQVVVLDDSRGKKGADFDYSTEPESKKLELGKGTAICPLYWCMTDEVPLEEPNEAGTKEKNRLIRGEDGELHCPLCNGKVRSEKDDQDRKEYSVIRRDKMFLYPKFQEKLSKSGKQVPCCFKIPQKEKKITVTTKEEADATFVLRSDIATLPAYRIAMLPSDLSRALQLKTNYENSVTSSNRFASGVGDVFRVGIGRASKTLPTMMGMAREIPSPSKDVTILKQCSFFPTWRYRKGEGTEEEQIVASIEEYFNNGKLSILQEVEYVTGILNCQVILFDPETYTVSCGFWSDYVAETTPTIAMIGEDVLAYAIREKGEKSLTKLQLKADITKGSLNPAFQVLKKLHTQACAVEGPTYAMVADKLAETGTLFDVILDPLSRVQAIYIQTTKVIIPVQPTHLIKFPDFARVHEGYHKFQRMEDLASVDTTKDTLINKLGIPVVRELYNTAGEITELLLPSGLRSLVKPQATGAHPQAEEVLDTIRKANEDMLLNAPENKMDKEIAEKISYEAELYDFLLYSLSKDIQSDSQLKQSIANKSEGLYQNLKEWFSTHGYEEPAGDVVSFLNKVRTPCGQFKKKAACENSSLCGWKGSCKIKVQSSVVRAETLLKRIASELKSNSKRRLLVLDGYMQPFFSTILYLELPHELITTDVPSS